MTIQTDLSVAANGDIRWTGTAHGAAGTGYHTVFDLHDFLRDLADDSVASGDDLLDITKGTPSDRSTDNIITLLGTYNIDDEVAEHLYDGSIIQDGGDTIYDGIVNYGTEGIHIEVLQDGALIANDFWNTTPNGESTEGLNRDIAAGISTRFMVKTRDAGADIDGRRLLGLNREFGYTYGEFPINGTSRGNNVFALTHSSDLNNQSAEGTVSGWNTVTNETEGYATIDVTGDGDDEFYYSEWNKDAYSINQFYERMKWLTRRGTSSTLYGLTGDVFRGITHEIVIDTPTGTFSAFEPVSWPGGTGQMFAINSPTAGTKMWIQILTGTAPTDGQTITGGTSSATAAVNVTVTERTLSSPFVGASTGSALIGAYGLGLEASDLSASDKLFDLDNTQQVPPNNVAFTVFGLVSGEDRVLVGPESGGAIEEDQLSASGTYTGGETTFIVQEAIPGDTPSAGTIRVWNGDTFSRVTYTAWSGSSFTGCAGVPACANGDNTWVSYIDELADGTQASFTVVYQADRAVFIRVRDGGASPIKTFETTGTVGSSGGSATAIRTSDS